MTDVYIDPNTGSASNSGGQHAPKRFWSDVALVPGVRIFQRAGQVHPVWNYRFLQSGCSVDRYGEGPDPIIKKTQGGDAWIYVKHADGVFLRNFGIDCAGMSGAALALTAGRDESINNVVIENVELAGSPDNSGLVIAGNHNGKVRNVTVKNLVTHHHFYHGAHCQRDVQHCLFIECESHHCGSGRGAHGFSAWGTGASAPQWIRWFKCLAHHTYDADGIEGQGFQADDNTRDCAMVQCESHHNAGAAFALNNSTRGVVAGSTGYRNGGAGVAVSNNSPGPRIVHNTLLDNMRTKGQYAAIHMSSQALNGEVSDNALFGVLTQRAILAPAGTLQHNNLIVGFL